MTSIKVYDLAREAMDAGKFAEAIDLFNRSIEEEHDHVTTRQLLGKCYLELGQHRRALHELFRVVRAQPENAGARITCAIILIAKGHAMTAKGILIPGEPIPKRLSSIILQNEQARIVFGLDE